MARLKLSVTTICLFLLLGDFARSDDGLCGIEPPKEGESCSGASSGDDSNSEEEKVLKYDYEEKPMTQEEAEVWEKRFYPKAFYTNKVDWPIRNELDYAEEHAITQLDKAVELFDDLIKKHPNSPRALYIGTRLRESQLLENATDTTSPDFKEKLNKIFDVYMNVMNRYKEETSDLETEDYDIMPVMFGSVVHHSMQLCADHNMTEKQTEILKRAMEISKDYIRSDNYPLMLIQNYLIMNDLKEAEKAVEMALEHHENNILFKFFKGVIYKATDRKKEGNKLLRDIDTDNTDITRYAHDLNIFSNSLFNRGLDHLVRIIHQEASKLHFILSSYQRPALSSSSTLEAEFVWDIDNNVGLSAFDEEFNELKEFLPQLKSEALKAVENVTNKEHWIARKNLNIQSGNYIRGPGSLSTLPLFEYGKRRLTHCVEYMPKTCAFFKSSFERAAKFKIGSVKLQVLDGKTKTLPLTGLTNMRLRLMVPIQIPQGFQLLIGKDTVVDKIEDLTVFDDSFEHIYDNEKSDQKAIWLSVDLKHPDLTDEDISRMMVTAYAKAFFLTF